MSEVSNKSNWYVFLILKENIPYELCISKDIIVSNNKNNNNMPKLNITFIGPIATINDDKYHNDKEFHENLKNVNNNLSQLYSKFNKPNAKELVSYLKSMQIFIDNELDLDLESDESEDLSNNNTNYEYIEDDPDYNNTFNRSICNVL